MAYYWRPYVPVARRRSQAFKEMQKLKKKGMKIEPIEIEGRTIACSFWGKAWCEHLESFSDFSNRLPRGRTYVRNGSVCHLEIGSGKIKAIVSGSELYNITINVKPLKKTSWTSIKKQCSGKIGTMLELLQGKLSDHVMNIVTDRKKGLMPLPGEIKLDCDCPDWATMCKHIAAVLYGVGSRLDEHPELLFVLRGVDAGELISGELDIAATASSGAKTIADEELADIFGTDIELDTRETSTSKTDKTTNKRTKKTARPVRGKMKSTVRATRRATESTEPKLPRIRPTGKSVLRLRKKLKLSVADFALELGVSIGSIYRWEKIPGKLNLRDNTIKELARLQQLADSK